MTEPDPKQKLKELEAKIAAAKGAMQTQKHHQEEHYSMANQAWRMVTEMVAGLGIGFGIGYGLDALFGTTPFLMVLFTLLGIAAGINVMLRSAAELQKAQLARSGGETNEAATRDVGVSEGDKDGD